jgi:predicted Zn-dependent protease with MMP-like domain
VYVAPDGILPSLIVSIYTVLTIYILAMVISDTEWIVSFLSHITLAESALHFGLSDADVGQYTTLLH